MANAYWRYVDPGAAVAAQSSAAGTLKRPRAEYLGILLPNGYFLDQFSRFHADFPAGPESYVYYQDEERVPSCATRDSDTIVASYDRYLSGISSYGVNESVRPMGGGMLGRAEASLESPLLLDASSTLYVEGLPADSTRREVAHIFRPFVGYREVRLVNKESRHPGADLLILCFVDFATPGQAAVALEALQGYKFDEHNRKSAILRLQFARFPGPRSAGGPRGRR